MDINFHYFAVKTIAIEAGFNETRAQSIAEYSQFVDDYRASKPYVFQKVPDFAKGLTTKLAIGYRFTPVKTGFGGLIDMAYFIEKEKQREILVPFHFIPTRKLSEIPEGANRKEYCTYQADITGSSLIKNLIIDAKNKYMKDRTIKNRMRLSILLHTFADTYAHQNFSGFIGWENYSYLTELKNTYTGEEFQDDMPPEVYCRLCSIGHTNVGHAPDFTYASFEMKYAKTESETSRDKFTGEYSRNNTNVFLDAAKQIFRLLYQIMHNDAEPSEDEWEPLKEKLLKGFKIKTTGVDLMSEEWNRICPNITYSYEEEDLWQNQLVPVKINEEDMEKIRQEMGADEEGDEAIQRFYRTADNKFFYYNVLAKEIRDAVIL